MELSVVDSPAGPVDTSRMSSRSRERRIDVNTAIHVVTGAIKSIDRPVMIAIRLTMSSREKYMIVSMVRTLPRSDPAEKPDVLVFVKCISVIMRTTMSLTSEAALAPIIQWINPVFELT